MTDSPVPNGGSVTKLPILSRWQPIETAVGRGGYIVGAWKDGAHWYFAEVFEEHDDWVDVHSDRIHKPTLWMPLPPQEISYSVTGIDASDPREFTDLQTAVDVARRAIEQGVSTVTITKIVA